MLKAVSPLTRSCILAIILALIGALLIFFLAPRFDLSGTATILLAAAVLAVCLLIGAVYFLILKKRASGPGRKKEARYRDGHDLSEPAEAALFGESLDRAIRWLRKSKMAESGGDAIYNLPWYLLAGFQGSGKSTLIVQSGFNFSYTDPKKSAGRIDSGPTANCDLWVANEALFIDPSGRHFEGNRDMNSCLNMLRRVKQHRPLKPIDGIILLVDTADLFRLNDTDLRNRADTLRTFLDMTMNEFGMVIPIYLLLNKSDLIEGFQEFFSKPDDRKNQLLGATFTREQYETQHPEQVFQQEFEKICRASRSFAIDRFITEPARYREKAFPFPKQLSLMKDRLSEFVGILFQHSQFREKPLFRGFYFTSGSQGGYPINFVAASLNSKIGMPAAAGPDNPQKTESYFINNLLTKVILPDRRLAGLSAAVKRRRLAKRMALAGALGILLPLIILFLFWGAYRDNRRLIETVETARGIPAENGKSTENLSNVSALMQSLAAFDCTGEFDVCRSSGRSFHWGLYAGEEAVAEARRVYIEKLNQLFMDQILNGDAALGHKFNGLKTRLRGIAAAATGDAGPEPDPEEFDPGTAYTLLKTVMMLSDETKASAPFLEKQLRDYWFQGVQEKDLPRAKELLEFYLHQMGDHRNQAYRLPASLADQETAERIRKMLLVVEPDLYYYKIIRDEGADNINIINLTALVGVENSGLFDVGTEVDGTYTKVGWEQLVRNRISEMKAEYETERSWVLGTVPSEPGKLRIDEKLEEHYFREYGDSWWNFLKSIQIVPFSGFDDASRKLVILSDNTQSPILKLIKAASQNTWGPPEETGPNIKGPGSALEREPEAKARLAQSYGPLHDFVKEIEGQESPATRYLKTLSNMQVVVKSFLDAGQPAAQIREIGGEAENALRITNGLLVSFDARARESMEPLLKQPIQNVLRLVDRATPVGKAQERRSTLSVSGIVRDKDKTRDGVVVALLELYDNNDYESDKEIMRAQTSNGAFRFPNPVNPGKYKICASENSKDFYCADVRLDRGNDGKEFELKRSRSRLVFGGGQRQLQLNIK
ncbi:MAG: type VI secretion system membrane subunit TssM [Acidobacteria bacterium]|nr:type VI secretion system membrane subunit TssM [Acidobacteriota bacterium]